MRICLNTPDYSSTMSGTPEQTHPQTSSRWIAIEGIALVIATPFLFFPEFLPFATLAALLALGILWLASIKTIVLPATPFNLILVFWGIALMVGIMVSADPADTLPKATGAILGLAVWRFLVISLQNARHVSLAVVVLLLTGIALSFLGIASLDGLTKIPVLANFNPFQSTLFSGLGGHINQVGGLICLFLPLLVSMSIFPPPEFRRVAPRAILITATLLVTLILILSQSRSGWIGSVVACFLLLVLWAIISPDSRHRRILRLAASAFVISMFVGIVWIGPSRILDLWLNPPRETTIGTLTTLNYRKVLWPWAVEAVNDFPFTGIGLGAFRQVIPRIYPLSMGPDVDISHAHNIFLQTALDVGLPGLIVYLALLFVALAVGWRVARHDNDFRPISIGLVCGLVAVHIFGLVDAQVIGSKPGIILWFSLGLLAAMNKIVFPPAQSDS